MKYTRFSLILRLCSRPLCCQAHCYRNFMLFYENENNNGIKFIKLMKNLFRNCVLSENLLKFIVNLVNSFRWEIFWSPADSLLSSFSAKSMYRIAKNGMLEISRASRMCSKPFAVIWFLVFFRRRINDLILITFWISGLDLAILSYSARNPPFSGFPSHWGYFYKQNR